MPADNADEGIRICDGLPIERTHKDIVAPFQVVLAPLLLREHLRSVVLGQAVGLNQQTP